jgi:hypothetical protein
VARLERVYLKLKKTAYPLENEVVRKIKYKVKELYEDIYLIESNKVDLAMMFYRVQEFYENPKYRYKEVAFWDLFCFHTRDDGIFSYADDFVGFNISSDVWNNYIKIKHKELTPWDREFNTVVSEIKKKSKRFYVIGTHRGDQRTLEHELAHAFYFMYSGYRQSMNTLIKRYFTDKKIKKIHNELKEFEYHSSVFKDEIQAYAIDTGAPESLDKYLRKKRRYFRRIFLKYKKQEVK